MMEQATDAARLELAQVEGRYAVWRLPPGAAVDVRWWAMPGLVSVTRTADELSVVAPEGAPGLDDPSGRDGVSRQDGFACLRVTGSLDFGLTGILAGLTAPLARAGVSVFALSTYDTDYLLVRWEGLARAAAAWREAGFAVRLVTGVAG